VVRPVPLLFSILSLKLDVDYRDYYRLERKMSLRFKRLSRLSQSCFDLNLFQEPTKGDFAAPHAVNILISEILSMFTM
jgi:hypothetical protein